MSAVSVKETTIDAMRAKMSGQTSSTNMSCTIPPQNSSGERARTMMSVEAMTARRTSPMPMMVASRDPCHAEMPLDGVDVDDRVIDEAPDG